MKKTVLFAQKWRISAPGVVINNPKIIDLFSYKFYVGPHKGGFGIVNHNPRRTYCTLLALLKVHLSFNHKNYETTFYEKNNCHTV